MVHVYTDGATVGWNGKLGTVKEVGIGYWISEKRIQCSDKFFAMSNNEAEYIALILAMRHCVREGYVEVVFYCDSEIIVHGATHERRTKNERMMRLKNEVILLKKFFKHVSFVWIPREKNTIADFLSKEGCMKKVVRTFVYEDGTAHSNVLTQRQSMPSKKPVHYRQKSIFEVPKQKTIREVLLGL